MADYCEVHFTWRSDKDPRYIISYSLESEDHGEDCETDPLAFPSKLELYNESQGETVEDPCYMTIACKPMYRVGMKTVEVISESRTVEVYNQVDGYLQTLRGKLLQAWGEETKKLYTLKFEMDEPVSELTMKFLSLGNSTSFELKRLGLKLCQDDHHTIGGSQLDIDKLRLHVESLGDQVPEQARSLLETLECYQKNQRGTLDDVCQMLSQSSLPSEKQSSFGKMTGLLSVFSQMNQRQMASPVLSQPCVGETREDPSIMADKLLSQVMSSSNNGDTVHSDDMYNFLQSVCGRVTKMREPKAQNVSQSITQIDEAEMERNLEKKPSNVDPAIEAELFKNLQVAEERIVMRVQKQLIDMENRLNKKLDRILELLHVEEDNSESKEMAVEQAIDLD